MNKKELYDRWHLFCLGLGVGSMLGALILSFFGPGWLMFITLTIIGLSYLLLNRYQQEKINSIFTDNYIDRQLHPWKIKDE